MSAFDKAFFSAIQLIMLCLMGFYIMGVSRLNWIGRIFDYTWVKVLIVLALIYALINNILYFSSYFIHKEERERQGVLTLELDLREKDIHSMEVDLRKKLNELEKEKQTLDEMKKKITEMESTGQGNTYEYQETVDEYNKLVKTYDPARQDYEQLYGEYLNKIEEYNQIHQELDEVRKVTQNFYTIPSFVKEKVSSIEGFSFEKWNPLQWGVWGSIATWGLDLWNTLKTGLLDFWSMVKNWLSDLSIEIESWSIWEQVKKWIDTVINFVKERANFF